MADTAAWVQAIGSIGAILVAVAVPALQHRQGLRDSAADRDQRDKEQLKRLVAGLRTEIGEAIDAAARRETAAKTVIEAWKARAAIGRVAPMSPPISRGSLNITDAVIYKTASAELGRLPPELVRSVVKFYSLAFDLGKVMDGAPTAENAYEVLLLNMPAVRMHAAIVVLTLEKLEQKGFDPLANLSPTGKELGVLAKRVGYPIEDVLKQYGLSPELVA